MKKILANSLANEIYGKNILFVTFASFEERCLTAITNMPHNRIGLSIVIFNRSNANPAIFTNRTKIRGLIGDKHDEIAVNLADPFDIRERLEQKLNSISPGSFDQFVLDVTTFTHEALAIAVDLLADRWPDQEWTVLYNGAKDYDPVHAEADDLWLSKRPSGVRSVLGFSGEMHPSRRLHLLILVGFEHERARYAIEAFEPNTITLGIGERTQSVSEKLADLNAHFFEKVDSFAGSMAATYSQLGKVAFSCTDSLSTLESVRRIVGQNSEFNTIICPMNTKLSTLGVILAAMENPSIQLAYVTVDEYNEKGYAIPSDNLTINDVVLRKKVTIN